MVAILFLCFFDSHNMLLLCVIQRTIDFIPFRELEQEKKNMNEEINMLEQQLQDEQEASDDKVKRMSKLEKDIRDLRVQLEQKIETGQGSKPPLTVQKIETGQGLKPPLTVHEIIMCMFIVVRFWFDIFYFRYHSQGEVLCTCIYLILTIPFIFYYFFIYFIIYW